MSWRLRKGIWQLEFSLHNSYVYKASLLVRCKPENLSSLPLHNIWIFNESSNNLIVDLSLIFQCNLKVFITNFVIFYMVLYCVFLHIT